MEETFEFVRSRLDKSGFDDVAGRRVVLTGGASQLPGIRELAQRMWTSKCALAAPWCGASDIAQQQKRRRIFHWSGRSDIGARFRYHSWFTGGRHAAGTGGFVKHRQRVMSGSGNHLHPRRSMDEAEFVKRNDKMEASRKAFLPNSPITFTLPANPLHPLFFIRHEPCRSP